MGVGYVCPLGENSHLFYKEKFRATMLVAAVLYFGRRGKYNAFHILCVLYEGPLMGAGDITCKDAGVGESQEKFCAQNWTPEHSSPMKKTSKLQRQEKLFFGVSIIIDMHKKNKKICLT